MPDTIHVYPVEGRLVLDPATKKPMPQEGLTVPRTTFWLRRIRTGDVTTKAPDQVVFVPASIESLKLKASIDPAPLAEVEPTTDAAEAEEAIASASIEAPVPEPEAEPVPKKKRGKASAG